MTTIRRILTILLAAACIGLVWKWIAGSSLAQGFDPLTAGEQFTSFVQPLQLIAGAVLVAVPTILLIRLAWSRIRPPAQGRQHRR